MKKLSKREQILQNIILIVFFLIAAYVLIEKIFF